MGNPVYYSEIAESQKLMIRSLEQGKEEKQTQECNRSLFVKPHIVYRFYMSSLIEGRAAMCVKSCQPAFSIGKQ